MTRGPGFHVILKYNEYLKPLLLYIPLRGIVCFVLLTWTGLHEYLNCRLLGGEVLSKTSNSTKKGVWVEEVLIWNIFITELTCP